MTNETGLANSLVTAINTPECNILTGGLLGATFILKWLFMLFVLIMIYQAVEKLAWIPFLEFVKSKIYKIKRFKK